jgi:hypothetical protein
VIPETFPKLEKVWGIVEMDVGSNSFDSVNKYWPAESHKYAAMVGVENTITTVGEVEDQTMPV